MSQRSRWLIALTCVVAAASPAGADDAASDDATTPLARQIADVGASLDRIAVTLDALLEGQRIDVMLKRIDLAERRLEPRERELARNRMERESVGEEIERLEAMRREIEERIDEAVRDGSAPDAVPEREILPQLDVQLEVLRRRLEDKERRVREIEDDIARDRERIEILDDTLQDLLDG